MISLVETHDAKQFIYPDLFLKGRMNSPPLKKGEETF
jgi:hypothetical protein